MLNINMLNSFIKLIVFYKGNSALIIAINDYSIKAKVFI
jgi:hypothetical protein